MTPMSVVPPPPNAPGGDPGRPGADGDGLSDLLHRCSLGDESAFAALYDATSGRVHGLVRRVVRDPDQAQEVTQETYLQIWRTSTRFDPNRGAALSWILTLAHRRAVDRVRSAEAAHQRDLSYARRTEERPVDSTAEHVHADLERARVRAALASLTEIQRKAVELAYFGGYTHTEVARLLDLPLGTAKTRIRDGLIRMRDAMGEQ